LSAREAHFAAKDVDSELFLNKNGKKIRLKITAAHLDDGRLIIDKITPEGKKETSWEGFFQKTSSWWQA
jgi:hypothetical protein